MEKAAAEFKQYQDSRSKTFVEAIGKYRKKYGRHPPPGFDKVGLLYDCREFS